MPDENNQNNEEVTIEQLQADFENAMNGWRRAQADFENYKRHKEKENKELVQFAREVTVAKLLPTLDVLGQALKHLPEYPSPMSDVVQASGLPAQEQGNALHYNADEFQKKYSNWQIGIKGILMQLDVALSELGVKKIEAIGKKFDPHYHEAVKEVESEAEDGTIVDELVTGYELNGKVIRPSQVAISKKK